MSKPKLVPPHHDWVDRRGVENEEFVAEAEQNLRLRAERELGPGPRHNPRRPPPGIAVYFQVVAREKAVEEMVNRLRRGL